MYKKRTDFYEDERLVSLIIKKDKMALSSLYDKYACAIFGVIYGITNDHALSEEVLQRAFCVFWQMAADYKPATQRFFTWMVRIAGSLAKESLKSDQKEIHSPKNYVNHPKELINLGM